LNKKPITVSDLQKKYPTAILIKTWEELRNFVNNNPSKTHNIAVDRYSAWVEPNLVTMYERGIYLSTHTFYGNNFAESTRILQDSGLNVIIDNWDGKSENGN